MIKKIIKFIYRKIIKRIFFKNKNLAQKFTIIHDINYWSDSESVSGPGSNTKNTKKLISKIKKIIKKYSIKTVVDAPCGDFNWMNKILHNQKINYRGIDIVPALIKLNIKKFSNKKTSFYTSDITKKKLPNCDLLISRDFLFHLSYSDIKKFFKNLFNSNIKYFLTSNHALPNQRNNFNNKDIVSGDFRKINLFDKPFNFEKNYETIISDNCDGEKKYLILFNKRQINLFLKKFL